MRMRSLGAPLLRALVVLAALLTAAASTWLAWSLVQEVESFDVGVPPPPSPDMAGGLDLCEDCEPPPPGARGFGLAAATLFFSCAPLALTAVVASRRVRSGRVRSDRLDAWRTALTAGFGLQLAGVAFAILIGAMFVGMTVVVAFFEASLFFASLCSIVILNVCCGVAALPAWRELTSAAERAAARRLTLDPRSVQ